MRTINLLRRLSAVAQQAGRSAYLYLWLLWSAYATVGMRLKPRYGRSMIWTKPTDGCSISASCVLANRTHLSDTLGPFDRSICGLLVNIFIVGRMQSLVLRQIIVLHILSKRRL